MSNKDIQDIEKFNKIEDIEEVEELDDLEEFKDIGLDDLIEHIPQIEITPPKKMVIRPIMRKVISIMNTYRLPLIYLDANLTIIEYTEQLEHLLAHHYKLEKTSFMALFYKAFDSATLKTFFDTIHYISRDSSWAGTLHHKCNTAKMIITKIMLFPIYDRQNEKPSGFVIFFQDITQEQENFLKSTFTSILAAARLKDNDTGKHSERVNFYSKRIAYVLYKSGLYPQVDMDFVENIGSLAAMHDVGKIGTPDAILQKPDSLTEKEWSSMWEHTINGALILGTHPIPMAQEIARSHHERWDGTGYPYNLDGERIPLSARIVAIADVYDALRMKRSYKEAFTHRKAVKSIQSGSGTHFDPALVTVFLSIEKEFAVIWDTLQDDSLSTVKIQEIEQTYTY